MPVYWSQVLVSGNCNTIIIQCYEMHTNCENFRRKNWAFDIKTLLSKLGFLEMWYKHKIDEVLIAIVKQRIYEPA